MTNTITCPICWEHINKHKKGSCLDAWIHKTLGHEIVGEYPVGIDPECGDFFVPIWELAKIHQMPNKHLYIAHCSCDDEDDIKPEENRYGEHGWYCVDVVPSYSERISTSWILWDKMVELEKYPTLHRALGDTSDCLLSWCETVNPVILMPDGAYTDMLAICRAFIKAVSDG